MCSLLSVITSGRPRYYCCSFKWIINLWKVYHKLTDTPYCICTVSVSVCMNMKPLQSQKTPLSAPLHISLTINIKNRNRKTVLSFGLYSVSAWVIVLSLASCLSIFWTERRYLVASLIRVHGVIEWLADFILRNWYCTWNIIT